MHIRKTEFFGLITLLSAALGSASCAGEDYPVIPSGAGPNARGGVAAQGGALVAAGQTGTGGASSNDPSGAGGTLASGGAPGLGGASESGGAASGGMSGGSVETPGSGGQAQGGNNQGKGGGSTASGGGGGKRGNQGGSPSGSSGGSGGASSGTATFAQVQQIITRTCAISGCHVSGGERPNLAAATLYTTLTSTAVSQCGGDRMVSAGDPGNSALVGMVNGQCGTFRMPEGCSKAPCIPMSDLTTIQNWIQQGAPQ